MSNSTAEFSELVTEFFKKNFDSFDRDKVGRVQTEDVPSLVRVCGTTPLEADLDLLKSTADPEGRGSCDFKSFCATMKLAFQHCVTETDVKEAFQTFDLDRRGFIAPHELTLFLTTLGDKFTDEEMNAFLNDLSSEMDMEGNLIYSDAIYKMTPEMYR